MRYATDDDLTLDLDGVTEPEPVKDGFVHILMPCMGLACGLDFLAGIHSGWVAGIGTDEAWQQVTCPACREPGHEALHAEQRRQQGIPS